MSRNVLVVGLGVLVFLVVAGALYLQILASARQTDLVWAVSRSVSAGDQLDGSNVRRIPVPHAAEDLDYFSSDLAHGHWRATHGMATGTLVFKSDVQEQDMALVTLSLRTPPPLTHGNTIDVYALVNNQTLFVGRGLAVEQQVNNNSIAVWVPASDEPAWITLQAGNVALYAARSNGIGVPQVRTQGMQEALATLSGGSATDPIGQAPIPPIQTPRPSASPTPKKP